MKQVFDAFVDEAYSWESDSLLTRSVRLNVFMSLMVRMNKLGLFYDVPTEEYTRFVNGIKSAYDECEEKWNKFRSK